jgi:hypothetical protein
LPDFIAEYSKRYRSCGFEGLYESAGQNVAAEILRGQAKGVEETLAVARVSKILQHFQY